MEFTGRLAAVPMGELLQWAVGDRRMGCLVLRTPRRQKRVFFEDGRIVGCYTDDPAEFFGRYLLLHGYVGERELVEALNHGRDRSLRLGRAVVDLGILSEGTVRRALGEQIADSVCDLFLWRRGVFYFEREAAPSEALLPDPLDPMAIALEGSRWVDEHDRIRTVFVHDDVTLRRGPAWPGTEVSPLERYVLREFEPGMTIEELYDRVKGTEFRFLEAVFDLTLYEILDIDEVGESTEGVESRSGSEIRMLDLLMEQAVEEEEVVFSRRHLSLPIEILEGFFPVWVEELDLSGFDDEEREFYRAIDGSRALDELVVQAGDARDRRMELVLVQLRRGTLALLPKPVSELEREPRTGGGWLTKIFGS